MNNTKFDWQTADDEDFILPPLPENEGQRRRRRRALLGVGLLLVAVALLAGSFVVRRERQLAEGLRQEVLASFNLWRTAVERQDEELFAQLLAPDDPQWRLDQQRLLEEDLIVGRPFLALFTLSSPGDVPQVDLSPDWQQATVAFAQEYKTDPDGDILRLQHTVVFGRSDAGWLQKAPDAEFWGEEERLQTDLLVVEYPARDVEVAKRIGRRLEADLQAICSAPNAAEPAATDFPAEGVCAQLKPFVFTLDPTAASLAQLQKTAGSLLPGASFTMPAPSLTGLPLDDATFEVYYEAYTRRLQEQVRTLASLPTPMPQQVIRTLCFNYPTLGPRLYRFDPARATWQQELEKRSFRALHPLGEGQGLILDEIIGNYRSPNTHLILLHEGTEKILLDEISRETPYGIVSPSGSPAPHLLLRAQAADGSGYLYRALNLDACRPIECETTDLPGYTVWSPDGRRTLISQQSSIFLADAESRNAQLLGEGTNGLWLDNETPAYVQFRGQDSGPVTALIMKRLPIGNAPSPADVASFPDEASSGSELVLFDSDDLARAAGLDGAMLFIKTVIRHPTDRDLLLVHAGGLGDYAGHYFIFTARLPEVGQEDEPVVIRFFLQREGALGGDDGHFGPNGSLPFLPSPDGRWLLVSELVGHNASERTFLLVDLQENETRIVSEAEPTFPAQFPSYDWSADGHWLVIAGNKFFRIIAPEYDYEQLLPHEFDYCAYTRWSD